MKQKQIHQKITLEKLKEILTDSDPFAVSIDDLIYLKSENEQGLVLASVNDGDQFDLNELSEIYAFDKGYFRAMRGKCEVIIIPLYVKKLKLNHK